MSAFAASNGHDVVWTTTTTNTNNSSLETIVSKGRQSDLIQSNPIHMRQRGTDTIYIHTSRRKVVVNRLSRYETISSVRSVSIQPTEDCSVGVMFWVLLVFSLSGFPPFPRGNVLMRNPEFKNETSGAFVESTGNDKNNVIAFCHLLAITHTSTSKKEIQPLHNDNIGVD